MDKTTALLVIDLQNDYFPNGKYPLWNTTTVKQKILRVMAECQKNEMPVILIQHLAASQDAPFFIPGSTGSDLDPEIKWADANAITIVKHYADSFYLTDLETTLTTLGVRKLLICGMMTQNCVTFTALSRAADKYDPIILSDCCTTVNEMLHKIALNALSICVPLMTAKDVFPNY